MDLDDPDLNKPDTPTSNTGDQHYGVPAQDKDFNNILELISERRPSLRLVKLLGTSSAKVLPFKRPIALIIGGFVLSAYALI
ncbi:MAG: hypothetical protein HON65_10540 [Rhodospirillales bacterium]|jgi:hypothetical protein|nr:hypothetical protein [Rhodospirillales bacterium]